MKAKIARLEKIILITIYLLLLVTVILIWYFCFSSPIGSDRERIGNYLDDIIIPFGTFLIFTGTQAVIFNNEKKTLEEKTGLILFILIIKTFLTLIIEFFLDISAISAWLIYDYSFKYKLSAVLMIIFMVLVFVCAVAEVIILYRLKKSKHKTSSSN